MFGMPIRSIHAMLVVLVVCVAVTGCELLGPEEPENQSNPPPAEALPVVQAIMNVAELVFDADQDDPTEAAYPTGMTVQWVSPESELSLALQACRTSVDVATEITGSFSLTATAAGDSATIRFTGSATLAQCAYSTASVDGSATFPADSNGEPDMDQEPIEVSGTLSLDDASWAFNDILDALATYETDNGPTVAPCRARFFAVGMPADGADGQRGGTVGFSPDGVTWDRVPVPHDVRLTGIATDDAGTLVAVAAESVDWKPQGAGAIYRSETGAEWSRVLETPEGFGFAAVHWAENVWVAVGAGGAVYVSEDGTTWVDRSPGDTDASTTLRDVAAGDGTWVIVGEGGGESAVLGTTTTAELTNPEPTWSVISVEPDANQVTPRSFHMVAYDPATTEWILASDATVELYYWDPASETATRTTARNPALAFPEGTALPRGIDVWWNAAESSSIRFIPASWNTDGTLYRSTATASSATAWSRDTTFSTSYSDVAPHSVVGGTIAATDAPRLVMVGGAGDIWYSDDRGDSWTRSMTDWYGLDDAVYRP